MKESHNLFSEGKLKKCYKMYKAGKSWMIAPLVFISLGAFSLGIKPVSADQINTDRELNEKESIYTESITTKAQRITLGTADSANQAPSTINQTQINNQTSDNLIEQSTVNAANKGVANKSVATSTTDLPDSNESAKLSESHVTTDIKNNDVLVNASVTNTVMTSGSATSATVSREPLDTQTEISVSSQANTDVLSSSAENVVASDTVKSQDFQTLDLLDLTYKPVLTGAMFAESKVQTVALADTNDTSSSAIADGTTVNVSTADEFWKALNNSTISTINLTDDINYGAYTTKQQPVTAIRDLTINGNNHQIDIKGSTIAFNPSASQSMTLMFNDLTMYGTSGLGGIVINPGGYAGTKNVTKLNPGVTQIVKYNNTTYVGSQTIYTTSARTILAGNSNFYAISSYTSRFNSDVKIPAKDTGQQNFESNALEIEDGAHITMVTDFGGNIRVNDASGNAYLSIGKNAVVNITQTNNPSGIPQGRQPALLAIDSGTVTVGEGSEINFNVQNAEKSYFGRGNGVLYISGGSLLLDRNAHLNFGQEASGSINGSVIYLNDAHSKLELTEGSEINISDANGFSTTYSDISMPNGGTILLSGKGAAINISNTGVTSQGNINAAGTSQIFVNNDATLNITNNNGSSTSRNILINLPGGTPTVSFESNANVKLEGVGTSTLIKALKGAAISIYRPNDVIFSINDTGTNSMLLDLTGGNINGQYVEIRTEPNGDLIGPFRTDTYQIQSWGKSSSQTADTIGWNADITEAGKNIADGLQNAKYLEYTAKDMRNSVTITQADQITSETSVISGTTTPNAYVTLNYYEDGRLMFIPGLTYNLTAPAETTAAYVSQADDAGNWSISLPTNLTANKILVAGSMNYFTPAYATAFVNEVKSDLSELASNTSSIASVAANAVTQAGIASDAENSLAAQNTTTVVSLADKIQADINAYNSLASADTVTGSNAAMSALNALNNSMAASDAVATNNTELASAASSAQASYASAANSYATSADLNSSNHMIAGIKQDIATLGSNAVTIVDAAAAAQNETLKNVSSQATSTASVAASAAATYNSASGTVSSAAVSLNSSATELRQIANSVSKVKAPGYASEATALTDSLAGIGSLTALTIPSSDAISQATQAVTNNAQSLTDAITDYANGNPASAAQSLTQASEASTNNKLNSLASERDSLEKELATVNYQVSIASSLASAAEIYAAGAYLETGLAKVEDSQLKTHEAQSEAATYPVDIAQSLDSIASLQAKINSIAAQYPNDSAVASATTAANSAMITASGAADTASLAVSQATDAVSSVDKNFETANNNVKSFYDSLTNDNTSIINQLLPDMKSTLDSSQVSEKTAITAANTASEAAKRAKQALSAVEAQLAAAQNALIQNQASAARDAANNAATAKTQVDSYAAAASDAASAAASYASQASTSASDAGSTAGEVKSVAAEVASMASGRPDNAGASSAASAAASYAAAASDAASLASSAAAVASAAASDAASDYATASDADSQASAAASLANSYASDAASYATAGDQAKASAAASLASSYAAAASDAESTASAAASAVAVNERLASSAASEAAKQNSAANDALANVNKAKSEAASHLGAADQASAARDAANNAATAKTQVDSYAAAASDAASAAASYASQASTSASDAGSTAGEEIPKVETIKFSELPETGKSENMNRTLPTLGLLVVSLLGIIGFDKKRKEDNEN